MTARIGNSLSALSQGDHDGPHLDVPGRVELLRADAWCGIKKNQHGNKFLVSKVGPTTPDHPALWNEVLGIPEEFHAFVQNLPYTQMEKNLIEEWLLTVYVQLRGSLKRTRPTSGQSHAWFYQSEREDNMILALLEYESADSGYLLIDTTTKLYVLV
ncbi:hypothetical protein TKK_0005779 [Trichogramma kaykai]